MAHSARVWNHWLGGKDNYPADREVGDHVLQAYPEMVTAARADRESPIRAVTHLAAEEGVRQFPDAGGHRLPAHNSTHEAARAVAPGVRVVSAPLWRPAPAEVGTVAEADQYCGVARKP